MKHTLTRWVEAQWWRRERPHPLLSPFSAIYHAVSRRHLRRRAKECWEAPLPLISVGNITAGGSGKTPFVIWLTRMLRAGGRRPVILCRGAGGRRDVAPRWVETHDRACDVGDEALLLRRCSGVPVLASRDRVQGARRIAESGRGDLIVLDDGFQYRHLARCCDVVLVPAEGVGNGAMIPAGPLREPLSALARADVVVRTSSDACFDPPSALGPWREWRWSALADRWRDWNNGDAPAPAPGDAVQAITSIARPERFTRSLSALGLHVQALYAFADHHRYRLADIERLSRLPMPVTTAKDAVKLQSLWPGERALWVLEQSYRAEDGLALHIRSFLQ